MSDSLNIVNEISSVQLVQMESSKNYTLETKLFDSMETMKTKDLVKISNYLNMFFIETQKIN